MPRGRPYRLMIVKLARMTLRGGGNVWQRGRFLDNDLSSNDRWVDDEATADRDITSKPAEGFHLSSLTLASRVSHRDPAGADPAAVVE
jgi:hypothetical protein